MAGAGEGRWAWLGRLERGIGVANTLWPIVTAVFAFVVGWFGIDFGRQQQAAATKQYLDAVVQAAPSRDREVVASIINPLQAGIGNTAEGRSAEANPSQTAQSLATIIRAVPTGRYTIDAPTFSVGTNQTALFCGGKHSVSYQGPYVYEPVRHNLLFNGQFWSGRLGERQRVGGQFTATLMEVQNGAVVLNVECG